MFRLWDKRNETIKYHSALLFCFKKSGSGELDFDEFVVGISLIEKLKSINENAIEGWRSLFQKTDSDSSGNIDKGELRKMLKELNAYPGDKDYDTVFKEIDIDGSGEVDFIEFVLVLLKLNVSLPKKDASKKSLGLNDFYRFFKEADEDNTGNIDEKEMEKLLRSINLYPGNKEFHAQFQLVDCDGSGELDFEEFVNLIKIFQKNEELKKKFAKLDVDGNGYLDFNEIKRAFKAMNYSISDQAIKDMIAVASLDGDNTVSFEEFCAVARKKRR